MNKKEFYILFIFLLLFSCRSPSNNKSLQIVREWQEKEIKIPLNIVFKSLGRDTLYHDCLEKQYKVLVYIDSTGCTSCKLQLPVWQQIIDSCNRQRLDVGFLFVVYTKYYNDLEFELDRNKFDYPIIYDYHNEFNRSNHFSKDDRYRTLLLDKNNKVLLVGSPIENPKMWALYKKTIIQSQ